MGGRSLIAEGWMQTKNSLRGARNKFLAETLEIPKDRWGFNDDEWGGIFPEAGLMQQHLECLAKRRLACVWNTRDDKTEKPRKEKSDENLKAESCNESLPPAAVRLDVPESVDEATMLAVAEALGGGMAKQYM